MQHSSHPGLSDTQFSALKSAGINYPEGPEKYNTEVKYGAGYFTKKKQKKTPKNSLIDIDILICKPKITGY
jgi:hypothetical protein